MSFALGMGCRWDCCVSLFDFLWFDLLGTQLIVLVVVFYLFIDVLRILNYTCFELIWSWGFLVGFV